MSNSDTRVLLYGTVQLTPAQPEMLYSTITGRCVCGDTIKLRADGFWMHGSGRTYCRRPR